MKKYTFLILLVLSSYTSFSQKTLEIYNYSSKTISLTFIATKPSTGIYPWFGSTVPSIININPGDQYVMQNNANIYRFPFSSPSSNPPITQWRRSVQSSNGNGSFTSVSSNVAWTLGNDQFFNYLSFSVNNGSEDGGNIGEPSFWVSQNPLSNYTYNWEVTYDNFTSGTTIFNTIVYYDI